MEQTPQRTPRDSPGRLSGSDLAGLRSSPQGLFPVCCEDAGAPTRWLWGRIWTQDLSCQVLRCVRAPSTPLRPSPGFQDPTSSAGQLCLWQSSIAGSRWNWLVLGAMAELLVGSRTGPRRGACRVRAGPPACVGTLSVPPGRLCPLAGSLLSLGYGRGGVPAHRSSGR